MTNVLTFTCGRQNSNSEVLDINWTATCVGQTCAIQSTRVRLLPVSRPQGSRPGILKSLIVSITATLFFQVNNVSVLLKRAIKQLGFLEDYVWLPTSTNSSLVLEQL